MPSSCVATRLLDDLEDIVSIFFILLSRDILSVSAHRIYLASPLQIPFLFHLSL
jgi:hypothetical protein